MAKRQKPPDHPHPWAWLCALAAKEGIDTQNMSLSAATDGALKHLEGRRDAGLPLTPGTVDLASRLIHLQGELAVSSTSSVDPFLERAYARARAYLLADRYNAGQQVRSRSGTIPAEPEPETDVTLYDLVSFCRSIVASRRFPNQRPPFSQPSRTNYGSVARIVVPVATIKGIHMGPGTITVRFAQPQEALEKLMALAMALGRNYEAFENLVSISDV